jgi:HPt (histidine-containing phosphotransfer) domain-containing protein
MRKEELGIGNKDAPSSFPTPNSSLAPIPGVDTEKGISMTGGTEVFYRRVLELFNKDALQRLPLLQAVPEKDALKTFITQVHSLKSASASIGAAELSAEAAALEAAGKSENFDFIKDNLRSFAEHLTEMTKNIRTALDPAQVSTPEPLIANSPPPMPDSSFLIPHSSFLIDLKAALKAQNAAEIDRILNELNQKQFDPKTRETLDKISDDVLMTEYGNALKSIEELLNANK